MSGWIPTVLRRRRDEPGAAADLYAEPDPRRLRTQLSVPHKIVVFTHVPKTAGSTVRAILRAQPGARFLRIDNPQERDALRRRVDAGELHEPATHILSGHDAYGLKRFLPDDVPIFQFAFLREPVSHFESFLSYDALRWRDPGLSAKAYLKTRRRNPQIRALGAGTLDEALEIIARDYFFVGLTGAFRRDFRMLNHLLDLAPTRTTPQNVLRDEDRRTLPEDLRDPFRRFNAGDFALVEKVAAANDALAARFDRAFPDAPVPAMDRSKAAHTKPTPLNADLDANNDYISLFLTGRELFADDPDRGRAFFDKAVRRNARVAGRVHEWLATRDHALAADWLAGIRAEVAADGNAEALGILDGISRGR